MTNLLLKTAICAYLIIACIGKWHKFVMPIGNDEVTHAAMTDDALRALCDRNGMSYMALSLDSRSIATKSTETTND